MSSLDAEIWIRRCVDIVVDEIEQCFADGRLRREDGATVARVTASVVLEIGRLPHLTHIDAAIWDEIARRSRRAIVRRQVNVVSSS